MLKVVSNRQKRANRRNARKSAGPKTPAGKARTARNALKHGLLAKDVVLHSPKFDECRAEFDALLADLIDEFRPTTVIEQTLVERIATCYWRLRRAQRFEAGTVRQGLEMPDPDADQLAKLRSRLEEAQETYQLSRHLLRLLDKPADQRTTDEAGELKELLDEFSNNWKYQLLELDRPEFVSRLHQILPGRLPEMQEKIARLRAELHAAERQHNLRNERRPWLASLPESADLLKLVRYENMLDRQIHRALNELRRLRTVPRRDIKRKQYLQNKPI